MFQAPSSPKVHSPIWKITVGKEKEWNEGLRDASLAQLPPLFLFWPKWRRGWDQRRRRERSCGGGEGSKLKLPHERRLGEFLLPSPRGAKVPAISPRSKKKYRHSRKDQGEGDLKPSPKRSSSRGAPLCNINHDVFTSLFVRVCGSALREHTHMRY